MLAFWTDHYDDLPLEHISPERIAALGIEDVDWSGCTSVEQSPARFGGAPAIRGTPVRIVDLLVARAEHAGDDLADMYDLPPETVRSVLGHYDRHASRLASAV